MADILIIDDQDRYADLCRKAMPDHRYRGPARSWREASEILVRARGRVECVLLDVNFEIPVEDLVGVAVGASAAAIERAQRTQGLHILEKLRARYPDLPVILMTAREELSLDGPARTLEAQEYTYFLDDDYVDVRALAAQIAGVVEARRGEVAEGPIYWGRDAALGRARQRLAVLARGRLPVVLLGPTGTGKSLIARHFVHARSKRSGRFVALDLSTIPAELMAAQLFGASKGSYTGAQSDRTGAFEAASGGTLFLDEVGNLSDDAQKMLLTVLQEGTVTRLGDVKERAVDVKLVVATNEDLAARVRDGTFRADLYMRLNPAAAIRLPPLRERQVDWEQLVAFCAEQALRRLEIRSLVDEVREQSGLAPGATRVVVGGQAPDEDDRGMAVFMPDRALRHLKAHPWPGNMRELAMTVENALLFALTETLAVPSTGRVDVVQIRPKVVRDLLLSTPLDDAGVLDGQDGLVLPLRIQAGETLNAVSQECERQYFKRLWVDNEGDFGRMAELLLGDAEHARKVQLRFNQLGLKVRALKESLA